jgi:hypothetical protein
MAAPTIAVPDRRTHRGANPQDRQLFGADLQPLLREAAQDLCWLLSRGYAPAASLQLVGNNFSLTVRQRKALMRACCSDPSLARRAAHRVPLPGRGEAEVWIDGLNVLLTIETALSGGLVIGCRDGCYRDIASVHGTYRRVVETPVAIQLVGRVLSGTSCRWLLDRPVSNTRRLEALLRDVAAANSWDWRVELHESPDPLLASASALVATADGPVLDRCERWLNLSRIVIDTLVPSAWVVDLFPR